MKEATGELNMTVVTLIAVAALGALFYFVVWPMIQRMVVQQTCSTYGPDWVALRASGVADGSSTNTSADTGNWYCCPNNMTSIDKKVCIHASNETVGGGESSESEGQ